jgi:hypothetical protein
MTNLLIVFDNVPQMISARVMRLSDRHGIVRKIYIAVVAEEFWHFGGREKDTVAIQALRMGLGTQYKALFGQQI